MRAAVVLALVALVAGAAAQQEHALQPQQEQHHDAPAAGGEQQHAAGGHHVSYLKGGADWEGTCKDGKQQSPINVVFDDVLRLRAGENMVKRQSYNLDFNYKALPNATLKHNGHALQVDGDLGFVRAGCSGAKYLVKQFHFHSPSEHEFEGLRADVELHIVHQKEGATDKNDLLVVGVMFQVEGGEGHTDNPFLASLQWDLVPTSEGGVHALTTPVDLGLLTQTLSGDYYGYAGSLTTPPCSETVSWRLFRQVQKITYAQLDKMSGIFARNAGFADGHGNQRSPQPLNGRELVLYERTGQQPSPTCSAPVTCSCQQQQYVTPEIRDSCGCPSVAANKPTTFTVTPEIVGAPRQAAPASCPCVQQPSGELQCGC